MYLFEQVRNWYISDQSHFSYVNNLQQVPIACIEKRHSDVYSEKIRMFIAESP